MERLSIRARIILLIAFVAFSNLSGFIFIHHYLSDFDSRFNQFYQQGVQIQRLTLSIARDNNFVSRVTRNIMLGDNLESNLATLDQTIGSMDKEFADLTAIAAQLEDKEQADRFATLIRQSQTDTQAYTNYAQTKLQGLRQSDHSAPVLAATWQEWGKVATPLANTARQSFKTLSDAGDTYLLQSRNQAQDELDAMRKLIPVLLLGATFVVGVLAFWVAASILRGLDQGVRIASMVAAGDLQTRIAHETDHEIGQLLRALSDMQARLRDAVGQINRMAEMIHGVSARLLHTASAVSSDARQQSDSTASMAATVEEMGVSISQMATSAGNTIEAAVESQSVAGDGRQIAEQTARDMHQLAASVGESNLLISTLNERSEHISQIVGTIKDIAEQTNLLALNAAIEAARAGEQGRGFAVVADEVRKLAERTSHSTVEISQMLVGVKDAARLVSEQMQRSVLDVKQGAAQAERTSEFMQRIDGQAGTMIAMIAEITDALHEQNSGSAQVAQRVELIAQAAGHCSRELESVHQIAVELDHLSADLKNSVGIFRA